MLRECLAVDVFVVADLGVRIMAGTSSEMALGSCVDGLTGLGADDRPMIGRCRRLCRLLIGWRGTSSGGNIRPFFYLLSLFAFLISG